MISNNALVILTASLGILPCLVKAQEPLPNPVTFCKGSPCEGSECPLVFGRDALGTGFPQCVVYNTEDNLSDKGFSGADGGGYEVWADIAPPDPGCKIIVRSPARVEDQDCGTVIGIFANAGCVKLVLRESFMMQFCCGDGDCEAAKVGAKRIRGMSLRGTPTLSGIGLLRGADGSYITPDGMGNPPEKRSPIEKRNPTDRRRALSPRDACEYTPDGEVFTANGELQIVATNVDGGSEGTDIEITAERSSSRTVSSEVGISWEVLTASIGVEFEESTSSSTSRLFHIPAGQMGNVGFTPILKCTKGAYKCDDESNDIEACTGFKEGDETAGTFAVIALT